MDCYSDDSDYYNNHDQCFIWVAVKVVVRSAWKFTWVSTLMLMILSMVLACAYRWLEPPTTAYMAQDPYPAVQQYVSIDHVSRYLLASVLTLEDQHLGPRVVAVDLEAFSDRVADYLAGEPDKSGSTIPQQLAKNLYLWPDNDGLGGVFRKALEFGLAFEMVATMSDKRLLELYVNYAQFGPGIYGICAATWYYFNSPPWYLDPYESAQLAGIIPLPSLVRRAPGGGFDMSATADPVVVSFLTSATDYRVPVALDRLGGWQKLMATVGITDTAADHAGHRDEESCSAMPDSVTERLTLEDPAFLAAQDGWADQAGTGTR